MTVTYSAPSQAPRKKARTALLPLLIALFVISYSILTLLVIEQGRTIESQRTLLREMLKDSNELAQLKGKLAQQAAATQAQPPARPEQKAEKRQADPAETKPPVTDKEAQHSEKPTRSLKTVPGKPAADLEDVRRATRAL